MCVYLVPSIQQQYHHTYSWVCISVCLCIHVCMMNKGFSVYIGTQYTSYDDTFFPDVTKSNTCTRTHTNICIYECTQTIQSRAYMIRAGKSLININIRSHIHKYTHPILPWWRSMNDVVFVSVGVSNLERMRIWWEKKTEIRRERVAFVSKTDTRKTIIIVKQDWLDAIYTSI